MVDPDPGDGDRLSLGVIVVLATIIGLVVWAFGPQFYCGYVRGDTWESHGAIRGQCIDD